MPASQPSESSLKRLFSSSSKKSKAEPGLSPVIDVGHGVENSGSTSTTLTEHGQVPSSSNKRPPSRTEQASLNTTHSNSKRKSFYQRRGANSEGALSSASTWLVKSRRKGRKTSFLSRFVYKVVPCVGHEPLGEKEKEKKVRASAEAASEKPAPAPLVIPPAEADVIVPPPPSAHTLPDEETDGLTSGAVQPPGSTGNENSTLVRTPTRESQDAESETSFTDEDGEILDEQAEEERLVRNGGNGIPIGPDGIPRPLLPPIAPQHAGRKCLVLDLDETLVHSSFKAIPHPDFIVPVEIEYHWHHFHVLKRPGVDQFLKKMGEMYEIVVFTASLSKYADPVLDKLDIHQVVAHRLFRESCFNHKGNYVKDLSQLGRPIADTIILDNSPASYIFNPNNAVPVSSWFNDPHDAELTDLIPFLEDLKAVGDIRGILDPVL